MANKTAGKNKTKTNTKKTTRTSTRSQTVKSQESNASKLTAWGYIWRLVISVAIPLVVGGLSALIVGDSVEVFKAFEQPPLSPPSWLFPVAWTILYILMGLACYLVWIMPSSKKFDVRQKTTFFVVYTVQLIFNFFWSIFFFSMGWHLFAFVWLIAMWVMILFLVCWAGEHHKGAMWLLLPYLLWVTFAGYLNIMIAILN